MGVPGMNRRLAAGLLACALAATTAAAQQYWGRMRREPPRFPTASSFDGSFNFCRLMYYSSRRYPSGQGWSTDYPDADINFSIRLSELTKTRVSRMPGGEPNHLVIRASDDELFQCPFVLMADPGTVNFTDEEITRLREYLFKGGFLWADDFWGTVAWSSWEAELSRLLPPAEFPVRDITPDHPIFRTMANIKQLPQIPSINHWIRNGGETSELGYDSAEPHMRAISDSRGRIMVLITHNTDISDAWEREGEDPRYFYLFSPDGYAVGINVLLYAMSH
jgi:hypothetical protein